MSGNRGAYKGEHHPLPDGRCAHRWANRLRRTVSGCPVAAVALRNAELAEQVRGLPMTQYATAISRAAVLALLEPRQTPPSEPEP